MHKNRIEAFSDGVLAIVITILVLELKVPHGAAVADLEPLLPVALGYLLSFAYLGIYWNNHHHLFQAASRVTGAVLWANLHLLFWLSLFPFATGWMGQNHFATGPVALYGVVLLMAAIAYHVLTRVLLSCHGPGSVLAKALGRSSKERLSVVIYAAGIGLAFVQPWVAVTLYVLVAAIWLVPDRRVERILLAAERNRNGE